MAGHLQAEDEDERPRDAAVVVNYASAVMTIAAVESILDDDDRIDVHVVDSASPDDSLATLEEWHRAQPGSRRSRVTIHVAPENRGFGAGCNLGIDAALGADPERVLLLNPDARLEPGALSALRASAASHPEAGIVGGRIVDASDRTHALFENGRFRPWTLGPSHVQAPGCVRDFETSFVTGALMWIDAGMLRDGLRFDERYFLYVEDLDLCRQVVARGRTLRICLDAVATHEEGGTQRSERASSLGMRPSQLYYVTRNKLLFARARLGWVQALSVLFVTAAAKPIAGVLRTRRLDWLGTFRAAVRDGIRGRTGPRTD